MTSVILANNYHYRRGGADVVYLQQTKMLQDHGWQVANFAMQHPKNEATEWSRFFPSEIEFGNDYSLGRKIINAGKSGMIEWKVPTQAGTYKFRCDIHPTEMTGTITVQ